MILAIFAKPFATPPKPNTANITARIKNTMIQVNIVVGFVWFLSIKQKPDLFLKIS